LKAAVLMLLIASAEISAQITFEAESLDGKQIALQEVLKNGPVLVNFWASWCQPCKAEVRHLKVFYEKYKADGFTILGINVDSPKSMAKVKPFVSSNGIDYPVVLDPNNVIFQKFNGQGVPYSILIDRDGSIAYKHTGFSPGDEEEIEEEIRKLLPLR